MLGRFFTVPTCSCSPLLKACFPPPLPPLPPQGHTSAVTSITSHHSYPHLVSGSSNGAILVHPYASSLPQKVLAEPTGSGGTVAEVRRFYPAMLYIHFVQGWLSACMVISRLSGLLDPPPVWTARPSPSVDLCAHSTFQPSGRQPPGALTI